MVIFKTQKIINFPAVGEILKNRREEKNLDLFQAAMITKISRHYLQALEESNYSQLPGEVYAKSFLKVYAQFLGLDISQILSQYLSEQRIYNKTRKTEEVINPKKPVERVFWFNLLVTPRIIRNLIIGILIIGCIVYLGIKIKAIVSPPILVVFAPTDNLVTSQKVIEITGQGEKEAILKINGQPVLTDGNGNFSEKILLQVGTNIIEITAQKKRSKKALIYRKVIVVDENSIQ